MKRLIFLLALALLLFHLPVFAEDDKPSLPPLKERGDLNASSSDFTPYPDRWRIVPPPYELNISGSPVDPYNQNVLKGDKPILGQDIFLTLTGVSDTLLEYRTLPTPSGASSASPNSINFFGDSTQLFINQNFIFSLDLFKGRTAFKPFDWRIKTTLIANVNQINTEERGIVNPDVRRGTDRDDSFFAVQELFIEAKLFDISPNYDFVSVRAGLQPFSSDFKGFIYTDTNLGVRFFGNAESNRNQYNVAFFDQREKDTNSGLNTSDSRGQEIGILNFYRQDFGVKGYTTQFSIHHLKDDPDFEFDENNRLARPDPVGAFTPHEIKVTYYGWAGSGHIGVINVEHAAYYADGDDTANPIAGRAVEIKAAMAAVELSYDRDWFRPKLSYFYASGDDDPNDDEGEGFDAIFDSPSFAGGGFSFWNRMGIGLAGTGVALVSRGSLLPSLRSSKEEGQPNFVNPGVHLINAGVDLDLTPKLKGIFNMNYLWFDKTEVLEFLLFQAPIKKEIGLDVSFGMRYRPYLNNNIVCVLGIARFFPGDGFAQIYESQKGLNTAFTNVTFLF